MQRIPKVHIINGGVFITYEGACYNEQAFQTMHPEVYATFFERAVKIDFTIHREPREVACV